jgi:hypothetical protein
LSSINESQQILNNLLKAKGISQEVISNIREAERDAMRVMSIVSQLSRGDISGLLVQLTRFGPYGIIAALGIGVTAFAYAIYQALTAEKPSEYYYWRYPT